MAQCNGFFNISNVAALEPTITGQWFSDYEEQSFAAGYQATARTYTGFIISSSASNISGTVAIYGLAMA